MNPMRRVFRVAFLLKANTNTDLFAFMGTRFYRVWESDYAALLRAVELKGLTAHNLQLGFYFFDAALHRAPLSALSDRRRLVDHRYEDAVFGEVDHVVPAVATFVAIEIVVFGSEMNRAMLLREFQNVVRYDFFLPICISTPLTLSVNFSSVIRFFSFAEKSPATKITEYTC